MQSHSVLLVDDDPGVLEALSPYFRLAGFDVDTAATGIAALDLGKSRAFDAVVCDVRLPGISGIEVLKDLREAGVRVPFIMMSGFGTVPLTAEAMRLGAVDFLEKPVDGERLVEIVRSVSESESDRSRLAGVVSLQRDGENGPLAQVRHLLAELLLDEAQSFERGAPLGPGVRAVLAAGVARADLNLWHFFACAEALRCVARASEAASGRELVALALTAIARGDLPHPEPRDHRVREALSLLGASDRTGLRMSEDACGRNVGASRAHLGRLLRTETGLRFRELRRGFRLKHAVPMLVHTDEHIRQIAYWVGFEQETQFTHEFRGMFGLCPREFRRAAAACPCYAGKAWR